MYVLVCLLVHVQMIAISHLCLYSVLFDIFDIDESGALNEDQLNLFLFFILGIHTSSDPLLKNSDNFDINKVVIRTKFIEYIQNLLNPPKDDALDENENAETDTNGTESKANNDGESDHDKLNEIDENDKENDLKTVNDDTDNQNNARSKSADKQDSEWEKIPLTAKKNDHPNHPDDENFGFLGNLSLNDLKNADDAMLMDVIKKLFTGRLYKKHKKVKKKHFIPFAAQCINFDHLFSSFMIIPTRRDEKRIIKELMQSTAMTLGASWFVVSKEWWDKWCLYTGYNEEATPTKSDDDDRRNSVMGSNNRNMRPIKISNRELLHEDSYFHILKKELRENDQFVLLPKSAWEQLHEWYGGGPSIERFVVCTDKAIRMKVINFTLKKLEFEYNEQQRLQKEVKKKKKSPKKQKKSEEDSETSTADIENGSFDVDKFDKEYSAFLQELSMMTHPETLRIDLHPIYCNFLPIDEKNKIADDW